MINKIKINLPQNIKTIIWKKNKNYNINIYNNNKKYKLHTVNNIKKLIFDKNSNVLTFIFKKPNYRNNKIINFFNEFLKSWDLFFFKKIKFKGKGFRMRFFKKNKFIKFFFGKSHKTFILFKRLNMKKVNKYKFILKSIKKNKILKNCHLVTNIKPINLYTLRGLRISRQIIFKRKGKKGTYI